MGEMGFFFSGEGWGWFDGREGGRRYDMWVMYVEPKGGKGSGRHGFWHI